MPADASPEHAEHVVAEYVQLREEMRLYNQQNFQFELYAFASVFGLYAWLASVAVNQPEKAYLVSYSSGLPVIIELGVIHRLFAFRRRMARLAPYIALVENRLGLQPGWENYLRVTRGLPCVGPDDWRTLATAEAARASTLRLSMTWRARVLSWYMLLVFSLGFSAFTVVTGLRLVTEN